MSDPSHTPLTSNKFSARARNVAIILGAYAVVGGLTSFAGWVLDVKYLADWSGTGIAIQPNPSLLVAVAGVAVVLLALGHKTAAGIFGLLPLAVGVLTGFEHLSGISLGIDSFLMFGREWGQRATVTPGRMGPPATISWNLLGTGFVIAAFYPQWRRAVPYLSLTAAFIALLTFLGYFYGADFLYALPRVTAIAWQTSTFILAIGIGLTLTITDREPMRTFISTTAGGLLVRRTLPIVVFFVLITGLLRLWGENSGYYDVAMGTTLRSVILIVFVTFILYRGAIAVSAYESAAEHKDRVLAAIVDSSHDAIVSKGLDSIITSWNAGAERLFGYTADEAIGKSIRMLIPDNRQSEEDEILARIARGETLEHFETVRRRKDGTLLHISLTVSPIKSKDGTVVGASKVARDITQQKKAEWTIRDSETKKAAILESALDCVITMDHEGRIVDFNPAAERTFGWRREQIGGKSVGETIVPERLRQTHSAGLEKYLLSGEEKVLGRLIEMPALRSDGTEFPAELSITAVRLSDSPPFFTAFIRDITKRKQAEQALRESEARFRIMADAAPVLIWISGADQRSYWFNKRWLEFVGRSMEQEIGDGWTENVHPDDLDHCRRIWTTSFDTRKPFLMEYRLRRHDGEYRWVLDNGIPRYEGEKIFAGYIGSCIDITERKVAERALRESERMLRAANESLEEKVEERTRELVEANALLVAETEARIEEQTQRIDIMRRLVQGQEDERQRIGRDIHDHLGQRLTALRLQLESLKSAMSEDATGATAQLRLDTLNELAKVLDAEVSYLAWELRPTVLDQFGLVETLRIFVHEWSKQFGVGADFHAGTLGHTPFDKEAETHLYRITQEALNNIAKHAEAKNVSVQLTRRDGTLSLIIEDDGRGFAAANGRKKKGTDGQGLRGMRERADLIGGEFEVESTLGSGTTVFVRITESSKNGDSA